MLDDEIWGDVGCFLDSYVLAESQDVVVIAYSAESRNAAAWIYVALKQRGVCAATVCMVALRDPEFAQRLKTYLPAPISLPGRLLIITLERDTLSHSNAIREAIHNFEQARCVVLRLLNAGPDLFRGPLRLSPSEIAARNTTLLERAVSAERLHIRTEGGTDLEVELDNNRYKWVSNRGSSRPGNFVILPPGEVATFPASIDGTLIADFAFNTNRITDQDVRLASYPIVVFVERSRAVHWRCASPEVQLLLNDCFQIPMAQRVGELGFGTNAGIDKAIPMNSHINERRPGVHLGFGDHNQRDNVVDYSCPIHLDLIAKGGQVWFDGDPGLFNAQYMTRMARIALMPPKAMRCRPSETL